MIFSEWKISARLWTLALLMFFLQGCGASPALSQPMPDAIVTATLTPSSTPPPPADVPLPTITFTPPPRIDRVMIVSFDGLRPDAIAEAEMDNVLALMESGAYTLSAQTIMPSSTLPSHASMLVGTCPAKHIVRWNEYVPQNGYAIGTDIFDLVHSAGLQTAMVVGKEKLRQVTDPSSTDFFAYVDGTDKIEDYFSIDELAIEQVQRGFNLMFVHFPDGDLQGHENGWMSRQQIVTYHRDDQSLGRILQALRDNAMYDSTIIIVTSDHGGHDSTHGENIPEDMTIPWIISGPRVVHTQITTQVRTMDTAATAAFVLGLNQPSEWDGAPVFEAFGLPVTAQSRVCR
ncbi:MAG: alkaline phosphatase family protein [Anaerolineales bacterium]|nr:alkaline phosphatase family protein [Anaerolineales bacterium]